MDPVGLCVSKLSAASTQRLNLLLSTGLGVDLRVLSITRRENISLRVAPLSGLVLMNLQGEVTLSLFGDNVTDSHFFVYGHFIFSPSNQVFKGQKNENGLEIEQKCAIWRK